MSNNDNSPSAHPTGIPQKPRQDVEALLNILRDAAEECRSEDPCLLMTGFFEHMPLPAWIKALQADGSFVMVHVNRPYTAMTGVTALDYLAQPDHAIWDHGDASEFEDEDLQCVIERRTILVDGVVPHATSGALLRFAGWKWPIMVNGDVVAVCGIAQIEEVSVDGR
ncbi:hypothetical protein MARCHEWKA_05740 [Brevundimonas phage vB_BpoS-Marchewka]|uniref:Uncharacterized protein n=1 Tax=Brevundimonas phage vB_BpoS-Marchewka TaxID=2948604 RepID=A0A9E7N5C1_9CAUD|nr:hypothetical protein MARCHEWKA_05740 [Brevundimonas phage vB_BpoS-Marchewka]UTC29523.1 hypothetical protein BAMBUS_04440 [Brevundimonas phage vB_BpoS-Bambus]